MIICYGPSQTTLHSSMHDKSSQNDKQWHFRDLRKQEGPLCWRWKQWDKNESEALTFFLHRAASFEGCHRKFRSPCEMTILPWKSQWGNFDSKKNKMELIDHPRPITSDQNSILLFFYWEIVFLSIYMLFIKFKIIF